MSFLHYVLKNDHIMCTYIIHTIATLESSIDTCVPYLVTYLMLLATLNSPIIVGHINFQPTRNL